MEKVNILKEVQIINDSVVSYEGFRPFLSTGNLNVSKIVETEPYTFNEKPSRANLNVKEGDLILARMKDTLKVRRISKNDEGLMVSTGFIVLRSKGNVDNNFLFHILKSENFQREKNLLCTGATQKAINNANFAKLKIPLPSLSTQKRIAEILDKAQEIIGYNQKAVEKYEELKRSLFLDMFGDPVKNEKGWGIIQIKDFGKVSTGNTPSRADKNNYSSNFIEWIKTDNIKEHEIYLSKAEEFLSESGSKKGRIVDENAVLVACIAGSVQSIGRVSLANRKIAFNQQINAIQPNEEIVHPLFLCYLIKNCRVYIQDKATNGMKRMLSKSNFEKIEMINPPIELQNKFSSLIEEVETQKEQTKQALQKSEELFGSLLQKAFRGELVSSKEEQKRHLIEMMKADEADGLYEM